MNKKFLKILSSFSIFLTTLTANAFYHLPLCPPAAVTAINNAYFGIRFVEGSSFYAKCDSIVSVSKQVYMLDDLEVSEVIIDLDSSVTQLRIYATTLLNADTDLSTDKMEELLKVEDNEFSGAFGAGTSESSSRNKDGLIVKSSPSTTHSKLIEYRVNIEELHLFYYTFCKHLGLNNLTTDCGTVKGTVYVFVSDQTM